MNDDNLELDLKYLKLLDLKVLDLLNTEEGRIYCSAMMPGKSSSGNEWAYYIEAVLNFEEMYFNNSD